MKQQGPIITLANLRRPLLKIPTILIDRTTFLGNPSRIGVDGTRDAVIASYKVIFDQQMMFNPTFKEKFLDLVKAHAHYERIQLACWCYPEKCHGSIIKQAMEEIYHETTH